MRSREQTYRFAVGDPAGRRSSVWGVTVQKADVYIVARMFRSQSKISLHATGNCRFARLDSWVKQAAGRKNRDRLIHQWRVERPVGAMATTAFTVHFPETDLRPINLGENLAKVTWLLGPQVGSSIALDVCITRVATEIEISASTQSSRFIRALPLSDGRWLVLSRAEVPLDGRDWTAFKSRFTRELLEAGIPVTKDHRFIALTRHATGQLGMIELGATVETD